MDSNLNNSDNESSDKLMIDLSYKNKDTEKSKNQSVDENNNRTKSEYFKNPGLIREIYYTYGKRSLNIEVCFKLEDLIESNKISLNDLENYGLIEALKDLDDKCLELLDEYIVEQKNENKSKIDINLLVNYIKCWKNASLKFSKKIEQTASNKDDQNDETPQLKAESGASKLAHLPVSIDQSESIEYNVYIGNIPYAVKENEIRQMIRRFDPINFQWKRDSLTGKSIGFAFAIFKNLQDSLNAIKNLHNYEMLPGRRLIVEFSKQKKLNLDDDKNFHQIIRSNDFEQESKKKPFDKENSLIRPIDKAQSSMSTTSDRKFGRAETSQELTQLYVKNLSSDVTESQIYNFFKKYGQVNKVIKKRDYAFVRFSNKDDALTALHRGKGNFLGKFKIEVWFSEKRPQAINTQNENSRAHPLKNLELCDSNDKLSPMMRPVQQSTPCKRKLEPDFEQNINNENKKSCVHQNSEFSKLNFSKNNQHSSHSNQRLIDPLDWD